VVRRGRVEGAVYEARQTGRCECGFGVEEVVSVSVSVRDAGIGPEVKDVAA
jgi:hypothetical protein